MRKVLYVELIDEWRIYEKQMADIWTNLNKEVEEFKI